MTTSILSLPFLPVRGFTCETDALTAHRNRLREASEALVPATHGMSDYQKYKHEIDRLNDILAGEKSAPAQDYAHACSCPRAAMAEGD